MPATPPPPAWPPSTASCCRTCGPRGAAHPPGGVWRRGWPRPVLLSRSGITARAIDTTDPEYTSAPPHRADAPRLARDDRNPHHRHGRYRCPSRSESPCHWRAGRQSTTPLRRPTSVNPLALGPIRVPFRHQVHRRPLGPDRRRHPGRRRAGRSRSRDRDQRRRQRGTPGGLPGTAPGLNPLAPPSWNGTSSNALAVARPRGASGVATVAIPPANSSAARLAEGVLAAAWRVACCRWSSLGAGRPGSASWTSCAWPCTPPASSPVETLCSIRVLVSRQLNMPSLPSGHDAWNYSRLDRPR